MEIKTYVYHNPQTCNAIAFRVLGNYCHEVGRESVMPYEEVKRILARNGYKRILNYFNKANGKKSTK